MTRHPTFDEALPASDSAPMSHPALEPFALFCAYHLGLLPDGTVRHANLNEVARRFGVSADDVQRALEAWAMGPARMLELDFDLAAARLDLQASPPGVDLPGIARMHWELFLNAPERPRDWDAELEDDARANRETFGERGPRRDGDDA